MKGSEDTSSVFDAGPISKNVSFAGWKPGDVIDGRLEIQGLIGKGGMGVVWLVHHREWNRSLAVKMPLPALVGSPTARDRFLREAETWIDLGVHPHIVQCWFVMEVSGLPCLFLDYLTGGSLKQWIDAKHVRPGQWQRILEITIQVSEGLAYSHSHGVIHRDVKPANLLIRGDERVCVTDFGIVKTAGDNSPAPAMDLKNLPQDISLTGTGAFLGTPQYGAPEQWGSAEEVDVGADIYALGVTLYEMCAGRRPFDSPTEKAKPEVLIERHLTQPAPDPREFFPQVPADLAQLALLCLEKDPLRRPQTMERLREALCTIYQRLVGQAYRRVGAAPSEQRPDTLNNRAVSLYSLSKRHEARDVWRKGLRIESGHPECLYNLTQVDRRSGRMESEEALRRLRQAKAGLPLALLCIEEGLAEEAVEVLNSIKGEEESKEGPLHRALGDACMYTRQYFAAEKAYRLALASMPSDTATQERKRLASVGKRGLSGKVLFPSKESVFNVVIQDRDTRILIDPESEKVVGVSATHITVWDIAQECVLTRTARSQDGRKVTRAWLSKRHLLLEDESSFELRRWSDMELVGRKDGRILAQTPDLSTLVVSDRNGVYIFDVKKSSLDRVKFPEDFPAQGRLKLCYDHSGTRLCMLTPGGRVAQVNQENKVVIAAWPEQVEGADDVTSLRLNKTGAILYLGHASGRLQALDFTTRTPAFDLRLPFPIVHIHICVEASTFVVELEPGFVIVDKKGRVLCQGDGPVTVDRARNRCLAFQQNRLVLYDLRPFRQLRRWDQFLESPRTIRLADNGRLAVSIETGGRFDVWEVDEDNRVYERLFLLSPGKSYAEIVNASKRFRDSMTQAQDCFAGEQTAVAYRHLNRARSVVGYAQAPEALDLNWKLLTVLRRRKLEAVWERLNLESDSSGEPPGPIALSGDGRHVLVTFGSQATLYFDTGSETRELWTLKTRGITVAAEIMHPEGSSSKVVLLDSHGGGGLYSLEKGHATKALSIDRGILRRVQLSGTMAAYFSEQGQVGLYNLLQDEVVAEVKDLSPEPQRLFPWRDESLIVVSGEHTSTLSLPRGKLRPLKFKNVETNSPLLFADSLPELSLLFLGFGDGLVVVCEHSRIKPILKLHHPGAGGVTGFLMVPTLSLGIASTDQGRLLFWDMHSGLLLDEFSAHRCGIIDLRASRSGRYLLTSGSDGQVRLWETSWRCDESQSEPELSWLPAPTALSKLGKFLGFGG